VAAPSILIVDDGELDDVQALLEGMQVDWVRCLDPECGTPLERPHDVIVTSGPRAMRMPALYGDGDPIWMCIYDRDFLPLREHLRELGIHYLVSGELAPRTLTLFLRQMLHRGEERRKVRRIPLHCEVAIAAGRERSKVVLLELSRESCVVAARDPLAEDQRVSLRLPAELTGDDDLDLAGIVIRATVAAGEPGGRTLTTVVRFASLEADAMARIHDLLSGHAPGMQVTPLNPDPCAAVSDADAASWIVPAGHPYEEPEEPRSERRRTRRRQLERRVDAIRWRGEEEWSALGKDLSPDGICVIGAPAPPVGLELGLAIYARAREEPLLVRARVVRVDGDEIAFRFLGLDAARARGIERLLAAAPYVEDLRGSPTARHLVALARS
jgi:hypothetical protein